MELMPAATFGLVFAIVFGTYWALVLRLEEREQGAVRRRLVTQIGSRLAAGGGVLKEVERLSTIRVLNTLLVRATSLTAELQRVIGLSGVRTSVGTVVLASVVAALSGYVAVVTLLVPLPLLGVAAGLLGLSLPYLALRTVMHRRLRQFEEQFPEAIDIIARTLRAGHAFTTGLKLASEELPEPVAGEFKALYDRQTFGLPLDDALRAFAQRVPVLDARFFVTAVLTQREAGGNLAEVLDNLAHVIRERFKVRRQVKAVSAHGRITGGVLAALPLAVVLLMLAQSPDHFDRMLAHPIGLRLAIAGAVLQVAGFVLIRRITNIRY